MNIFVKTTVAAVTIAAFAGCSNDATSVLNPASSTNKATQYTQIERLSRPAIKEVFENFNDHKTTNGVEPYNSSGDPLYSEIAATEDFIRPANASAGTDYGKTLQGVLYPDEYAVNLSGSAPSGADPENFLSYEVSGGTQFGGRAPNDDVIDLELGVLFGKTLSAIGVTKDDGEENNCLSSQNIGGQGLAVEDPSKMATSTFPYLASPH